MKITLLVVLVCACVAAVMSFPQPEEKKDGVWSLGADNTRNGGTVVRAEANMKWDVSDDSSEEAEVHGHWPRRRRPHQSLLGKLIRLFGML
ncbi:hypothetical protein J6590_026934 [Homalodisca vitripennis]|nr:hypothetical protein J6590_026934 [Homalodisca vitripennis]